MSKPFNLADAKAGHPVQTVDGQCAAIFKFDARTGTTFRHIGTYGDVREHSQHWGDNGETWLDNGPHLVMAPIGTIDGKPVYPGDMIQVGDGEPFAVAAVEFDWADAKWPRKYPATRLNGSDLWGIYQQWPDQFLGASAVANAAIRHGIDNRYLLDPTQAAKNIHNAVSTFSSEVARRHAIVHIERERKMIRAGIQAGIAEAYAALYGPGSPLPAPPVPLSDAQCDALIAKVK